MSRRGPAARKIRHQGRSLTTHEWAEKLGISAGLLYKRLRRMDVKEALSVEVRAARTAPTYSDGTRSLTLRQWSEAMGLKPHTVYQRIRRQGARKALASAGPRPKGPSGATYTFAGETFTLAQWAEVLDINLRTLRTRRQRGWSGEKMFAP